MATDFKKLFGGLPLEQVPEAMAYLGAMEDEANAKRKADALETIKKAYDKAKNEGIDFTPSDFSFVGIVKAKGKAKPSTASTIPRFIRVYKGVIYPVKRGKVQAELAEFGLSKEQLEKLKKPNPEHPANKPKAKKAK